MAFRNLRIEAELIPIEWKRPLPGDSFDQYCERIIDEQMEIDGPVNLMGVSFGGIVAQTIASNVAVHKLILISTITDKSENPLIYRAFNASGLPHLIPKTILNKSNPILNWAFEIRKKDSGLFKKIMAQTDTDFAKWALIQYLNWDSPTAKLSYMRIHGTYDKVIPFPKNDENVVPIENGSHLMILNKAKEISASINKYISIP